MRIFVRVKPGAKERFVSQISEDTYEVRVQSPARAGEANRELIELLADYFAVQKNSATITSGLKSKNKIITIT